MSRWALTFALLAAWELAVRFGVTDPKALLFVPRPSDIIVTAWALARSGELGAAIVGSSTRVVIGSALAVAIGVPLGTLVARAPGLGAVLDAPLRLLRPIPPVAWVPLTMVWFGVTEAQQVAVLTLAALFVVSAGTTHAVAGVPRTLLLAAENLGAPRGTQLFRVALPAALPGVAAAVREGVGVAWFVLVAAELLAASRGLGVLILEGRDQLTPARSFVGMGALAGCGALTDRVLARVQQHLGRWR